MTASGPTPAMDSLALPLLFSDAAAGAAVLGLSAVLWRRLEQAALTPMARALSFDHGDEGVLVLDRRRRLVGANPAARTLLGLEPQRAAGDGELAGALDAELLERLHAGRGRERIRRGERVLEVRLLPLRRRGRPAGSAVLLHDVSEQERIEAELRTARAQLESAGDAKSRFLATMSHELRTPLTAVFGYADVVLSEALGPLTAPQRESLAEILSAGRHLNRVVGDMLDYADLEASEAAFRPVGLDLRTLLAAVVAELEPRAARRGLAFRLDLPDDVPLLRSDAAKLRRILYHLLDNGVKFTERGGVTLRLERRGERLRIEVSDTGIGIPEGGREAIFEAFTQLDGSDRRRFGGSGLGLALCRRYSALIGAELTLESEAGRGSTFRLELPLEPAGTNADESRPLRF